MQLANSHVSLTTDLGTESLLSVLPPFRLQALFPWADHEPVAVELECVPLIGSHASRAHAEIEHPVGNFEIKAIAGHHADVAEAVSASDFVFQPISSACSSGPGHQQCARHEHDHSEGLWLGMGQVEVLCGSLGLTGSVCVSGFEQGLCLFPKARLLP